MIPVLWFTLQSDFLALYRVCVLSVFNAVGWISQDYQKRHISIYCIVGKHKNCHLTCMPGGIFLNPVSTLFSLFIMFTILTNCFFMAMSEPAPWTKYLEWVHTLLNKAAATPADCGIPCSNVLMCDFAWVCCVVSGVWRISGPVSIRCMRNENRHFKSRNTVMCLMWKTPASCRPLWVEGTFSTQNATGTEKRISICSVKIDLMDCTFTLRRSALTLLSPK